VVVVIGGGVAGAMAALAARAAGAPVELRSRAWGATALSSGAIDLAGDPGEVPGDPWPGRPSAECNLQEMLRRNAHHPLRHVRDKVGAALDLFCQRVPLHAPRPLAAANLVVPTDLGTWKSTFLAQRTQAAADLPALAGKRLAVLGLRGWGGFRAKFLAASLQELAQRGGVALEIVPETMNLPDDHLALREPHEIARRLDAPGEAERLGEALAPMLRGFFAALLPPVLGLVDTAVPDRVAKAAGVPVFEPLASDLSVPGLRLQMALDRALQTAGVTRSTSVERPSGPTVLATGRFLGGGIVRTGWELVDPVFGLRAVAMTHDPLASAGLVTDDRLHPDGAPPHLFAAGAVLGGYDPIGERCGMGTAIVTGFAAGRFAAEAA